MKILFFDMEFANGKIPGSVYSFGYVQTDRNFRLIQPQTDLLINPDCAWNDYVRWKILAYPMKAVEQASLFPAYYKRLKKLLCCSDLVVGFAVKNDTTALRRACERYRLKPLSFRCLDLERVCRSLRDYPEAHGLDGLTRAYTGIEPENRHRSDGDAYATMMLLRAICNKHGVDVREIPKMFAAAFVDSLPQEEKKRGKRTGDPQKASATPADPTVKETSDPSGNAVDPTKKKRRRRKRHRHPNAETGVAESAASSPHGTAEPESGKQEP